MILSIYTLRTNRKRFVSAAIAIYECTPHDIVCGVYQGLTYYKITNVGKENETILYVLCIHN